MKWINSYNSLVEQPKGACPLPMYGGGQFISRVRKGLLHGKLFGESRRAEFHKVESTNDLNQHFPESQMKMQIVPPNLRPVDGVPIVSGGKVECRSFQQKGLAYFSASRAVEGEKARAPPKQNFAT